MANNRTQTVGKISSDLSIKKQESRSPIELERAMQEDYVKELTACVDRCVKSYLGDFFVVVITKNERLMPNVFRNYFMGRQSCPTPDYDQTVFKFDRELSHIEYLWTIPSRDACHYLKDNALQVAQDERGILNFVLQFADGTLFELSKKLNSEASDSPLLIDRSN